MVYTRGQLEEWLSIAEKAAQMAGAFLAESRESARRVTSSSGRDIKIEADRLSEEIILRYLQEQSTFSILSEECGLLKTLSGSVKNDLTWVVDPLDGSLNYSKGIPICCVSIGLWRCEEPLIGAVYDFTNGELFSGIAGQGAWLNGESIAVSNTARTKEAILCTGFPVKTDFSPDALNIFVKQVSEYKKIRLIGSAALSLAYVASGRVDAYMERDIMIWDIAGGVAIVLGAGGLVSLRPSNNALAYIVCARAPSLPAFTDSGRS
jgi:myo-inositol-1(or 4)-monophosphatase